MDLASPLVCCTRYLSGNAKDIGFLASQHSCKKFRFNQDCFIFPRLQLARTCHRDVMLITFLLAAILCVTARILQVWAHLYKGTLECSSNIACDRLFYLNTSYYIRANLLTKLFSNDMNSMKGKRQADREGYVQQPPDYEELDYQTRSQQSQPVPEHQTRNETGVNHDVSPPRRLRHLLSGNFTNRIFTFSMNIAAIILASILVRRQGDDFRMSQKMVRTRYSITFVLFPLT